MYDIIIIGSGPAGYAAGIYAARREMKAMLIGKEPGGQVMWASEIENYPGFKNIDNFSLINKMETQVKELGVEMKTNEVKLIEKIDEGFKLTIGTGDEYEAKTVLVAIGLTPRRLAIKGESEFTGKGVTYCANCDGPFYRDKVVAVVGGGNAALDAAEVMSKIASKVYLVHRRDEFRGFEVLVDEVKAKENIELVLDSEIEEIVGDEKVNKILVNNIKTSEKREIDVDGVFIEIGRIASTDIVDGLADRDEKSQILVDEKCKTSCDGLFAAGDVTQVPYKQITIASGQGTIAALAAYEYIQLSQGKKVGPILDRSVKK